MLSKQLLNSDAMDEQRERDFFFFFLRGKRERIFRKQTQQNVEVIFA